MILRNIRDQVFIKSFMHFFQNSIDLSKLVKYCNIKKLRLKIKYKNRFITWYKNHCDISITRSCYEESDKLNYI